MEEMHELKGEVKDVFVILCDHQVGLEFNAFVLLSAMPSSSASAQSGSCRSINEQAGGSRAGTQPLLCTT